MGRVTRLTLSVPSVDMSSDEEEPYATLPRRVTKKPTLRVSKKEVEPMERTDDIHSYL